MSDHSISAADFDVDHGVSAKSGLLFRLAAEAQGEDYPSEIEPWGGTSWWVLGRAVGGLKVGPGQTLVDMGCGRGKPGLWLSRALGSDLIGIDWSPVAVRIATEVSAQFVPPGRARFQVGDLAASGLEDGVADAAVCFDAIFFATDRVAALSEICRILRPGGRFVFTADERVEAQRPADVTDWTPLLRAAGFDVESKEEIPRAAEHLSAMYKLWLANLEALRAEIGDQATAALEGEAKSVGPTIGSRRPCLVVARKPHK
jgi:ubiquinone/menaquinone biosynthesis C-methylase UbiE